MENIMYKEGLCDHCPQVEIRYKSRLMPVVATLLSVAVVVLSSMLKDMEDLSTVLLTIGVVALVASAAKLVAPSKVLIYTPTGEKIRRSSLSHKAELAERVEHALGSGNTELVRALAVKESAPLMTVLYSTPSESLIAGQTLEYIPYEYQPKSKVYIFTK